MEGFSRFSDKPGNYWAWKSSFEYAFQSLHLTASKELDLLTKWLGDESSQHAKHLIAVHMNNPSSGQNKVWERLEECYDSLEALEKTLFDGLKPLSLASQLRSLNFSGSWGRSF